MPTPDSKQALALELLAILQEVEMLKARIRAKKLKPKREVKP